MLERRELEKLSKTTRIKPYQQEKHYIQNLILLSIAKFDLVFKGGTYLWFCYNIGRFSEDLDFTAKQEIPQDLPDKIILYLKLYDVDATYTLIKNDSVGFSFRINARGPLYVDDKTICYVYVEISKREIPLLKTIPKTIEMPMYDFPVTIISGMDLNEVFAEKVRAIMTRNKARDIFDLHFLIKYRQIKPDYNLIDSKLDYVKLKYSKDLFYKSIQNKEKIYLHELKGLVFDILPEFKEVSETIKNAFE